MSRARQDTLHYLDFYGEDRMEVEGEMFDILTHAEAEKFDIIHVNCIPYLAAKIKRSYPKKKVILEYHGSDARTTSIESRMEFEETVDAVVVCTRDLMNYVSLNKPVTHIPNPVDIEHFKPSEHKPGALFIKAQYYHLPTCIPFEYTVRETDKRPIPHSELPEFLKGFDTYVDIKNHQDSGPLNAPR